MQSIDNNAYKRSLASLAEYPALLLSFTLYKGLTSLLFFLNPYLPESIPALWGSATSVTIICIAIAACCVFFAAAGRQIKAFDDPRYLSTMSAALILGTLLLCHFTPFIVSQAYQVLCFSIGILLMCVGACAIHIEFGRLMGYLGATYTLIFNVGCSVLGIPVTAILLFMPMLARTVFSIILIAVMVCTFYVSVNRVGKAKVYGAASAELTIP